MTVQTTTLSERIERVRGNANEYFLNMGPQHPSTHGVLRLLLRMDGETIREVIPVLGYVHRGIEKMGEHLTYRQFVHLTDRLDYLSALMNNWAFVRVVEAAAGIETNPRIETIRTILAELQRIQSHLLWWGVFAMDLGAITPYFYGFRDREMLTEILEETIGARLNGSFIQPGGLMADLQADFPKRVKDFFAHLRKQLPLYDEVVSGNVIVRQRTVGVGTLSAADALALGTSGPVLRASGVPQDLRKVKPYGVYDKVSFSTAVGSCGDSWDRYWVRLEEIRQSMAMVESLLEDIPNGKTMTIKPAARIVLPEGRHFGEIETARGRLGVVIVSDGKSPTPHRVHLRTPCFNNLWCLTKIAVGGKIADLVTIASSLDLVIPDMDR